MEPQLSGIPETMLIPLWAKAAETACPEPIVHDPKAREMVSRIDYDFSQFKKSSLSQVGVSIRTMILDRAVGDFLSLHRNAVVINLGAGLDTRLDRLSREGIDLFRWYDLDVPEAVNLRGLFFEESETNVFISKSFFDFSWMDDVQAEGHPVLIVAEGVLMYFQKEELKPLFKHLVERFPQAEMLFETLAPFLVGKGKHHDSLGKLENVPEFRWGVKDPREVESLFPGLEYVEDWNYFDFHKKRWKGFGRVARLPFIKPMFSNRIVRLRFK